MESISVFDMLKVGVGPSSSHTLGPWRAAARWIEKLKKTENFDTIERVTVNLYGSLSLTGKGHATDIAVMMGLLGTDPVTFPIDEIDSAIARVTSENILKLNFERDVPFIPKEDIKFNRKFLEFHPNGMTFTAFLKNGKKTSDTYYSIGGGFLVPKERIFHFPLKKPPNCSRIARPRTRP